MLLVFPSHQLQLTLTHIQTFIHTKMMNYILNVITFSSCDITPRDTSERLQ